MPTESRLAFVMLVTMNIMNVPGRIYAAPKLSHRVPPRESVADKEILVKHYIDKGWGKPTVLVHYAHIPHLYRADFNDKGDYAVVHDGKVVDHEGLDAMADYMKDINLMSQTKVQSDDIIGLLLAFRAFPAVKDIDPEGYYTLDDLPRLKPRIARRIDEVRFVINYLLPNVGGAVPHPKIVTVKQWTLDIPKSYVATWHEQTLKVDTSKP
jgi:hypothetical protein